MKVGIVGGGQLGMMLGEAAGTLDITCRFFDPSAESPAKSVGELICAPYEDTAALERFAQGLDVITYEFENVPLNVAESLAQTGHVYPPPAALKRTQDRLMEKELLSSLGVPVAPFIAVSSDGELKRALAAVGTPAVLKTRRMGYDGKGQAVIGADAEREAGWAAMRGQPAILEGYVPFDRELSIIAVRSRDGQIACYPLVENQHRDGILRLSRAPAPEITEALQGQAETYVTALLTHLEYVGVITIELFQVGDELLGNEIAPRVHNSGHWTIEGAQTSQFSNHLRAICGLPLGSTKAQGLSAMVNLIGTMPDLSALRGQAGIFIHDYGKEPRAGRKLGHITVCGDDEPMLLERLKNVQAIVA